MIFAPQIDFMFQVQNFVFIMEVRKMRKIDKKKSFCVSALLDKLFFFENGEAFNKTNDRKFAKNLIILTFEMIIFQKKFL